jgi:para-aminobenzoate synthetase component 1
MVQTPTSLLPKTATFPIDHLELFKQRAFQWASAFKHSCYLDSNEYPHRPYGRYECLIGAGALEECSIDLSEGAFDRLKPFLDSGQWSFGYLSYDLKNAVERLRSDNPDGLGFPIAHFFRPVFVVEIQKDHVRIHSNAIDPVLTFQEISNTAINTTYHSTELNLRARISKEDYLHTIEKIRQHIIEGDFYEMNFCQEFFAEQVDLDPIAVFRRLNQLTRMPFAAFYRLQDHFALCASPERFLQKNGSTLISQPIKGTQKRGVLQQDDHRLKKLLYESEKDRAENVMIVDLVRNDLARSCRPGTVKVEELFGIYPFENVFQMISTVSGELRPDCHWLDALQHAFPMGSMTGAPKVRSMELIETYEQSRRGLYSGAIGYVTPEGDFDFNVVIRSILYHQASQYLSFQVGGAIVFDSIPEHEYEECMLKAASMLKVLQANVTA